MFGAWHAGWVSSHVHVGLLLVPAGGKGSGQAPAGSWLLYAPGKLRMLVSESAFQVVKKVCLSRWKDRAYLTV